MEVLLFLIGPPVEVQGLERLDTCTCCNCTQFISWKDLRGDFVISRYDVRFSHPVNGPIKNITTSDTRVEVPIDLLEIGVEYSVVVVAFDYANRKGDVSNSPFKFTLDGELDCSLTLFFSPILLI